MRKFCGSTRASAPGDETSGTPSPGGATEIFAYRHAVAPPGYAVKDFKLMKNRGL